VKINEKSISHEYKTGKVLADNILIINIYIYIYNIFYILTKCKQQAQVLYYKKN